MSMQARRKVAPCVRSCVGRR